MPRLTKGGKKTAAADVEDKLKAEYPDNPGAVYGTLNKAGLMHGNKTTTKGEKAARHQDTDADESMKGANMHGYEPRHTSETR